MEKKHLTAAAHPAGVCAVLLLAKLLLVFCLGHIEPGGAVVYWDDFPEAPRRLLALGYQWDSVHYIQIAQHGYPSREETPLLYSFAPLYPLMIAAASTLGCPYYLSGIIISNLFSFAAVCMFFLFARLYTNRRESFALTILFALFPTNLVYGTVAYSEAPYLFAAILSLYFLMRRRYLLSAIFLTLAVYTRYIALFLIPVQILIALYNETHQTSGSSPGVKKTLWLCLPFVCIGILFLYFRSRTGDFFIIFHSGGFFGDDLKTPVHQFMDLANGYYAFLTMGASPLLILITRYIFTLPYACLTALLVKDDRRLALYGGAAMAVTLSLIGIAAAAAPRIMLAAWVAILAFKGRLSSGSAFVLSVFFVLAGILVMYLFQTSFFI
jgi:hypothetical protein